jgi:S-adenosylmethionine-dependent methyltransferase
MRLRNKNTKEVEKYYNKIAKEYDRQYETPYWRLYNEITWNNIKKFLPKKKNALILDAGGGTGYWAIKLAKLGYRVMLTDISEEMLKVAQIKIKKEKLESKIAAKKVDIREMSCFSSNYFDMALAEGDPVSYCLESKRAIKELARVVKPKSPIIVSVDSKYPRISRLIAEGSFDKLPTFIKTGILKKEHKFQAFTPEELRKLFEDAGLKVVRIIGKPVLVQFIPREEREKIIKKHFRKILNLELKFYDKPSLIGSGGHLEIVGIKQK